MRYSLAGVAVLGTALTLGTLATAILAGGVGKNGSTVAVSDNIFILGVWGFTMLLVYLFVVRVYGRCRVGDFWHFFKIFGLCLCHLLTMIKVYDQNVSLESIVVIYFQNFDNQT